MTNSTTIEPTRRSFAEIGAKPWFSRFECANRTEYAIVFFMFHRGRVLSSVNESFSSKVECVAYESDGNRAIDSFCLIADMLCSSFSCGETQTELKWQ